MTGEQRELVRRERDRILRIRLGRLSSPHTGRPPRHVPGDWMPQAVLGTRLTGRRRRIPGTPRDLFHP